ncbi:MAG TPA: SDR family NAD(P)-dependent oxidoreductase [Phenylobacterium sp.]|jgi:NAD(P)-dependent dehydrogenase (short-subunit alcohol dehydrogenase family)|uniref:SDR family NAD(P)-dependent oxidoreductase n=1 Tax=Phenylobacterium sp. TaxID=1871053 RepID=UPI002C0894F1|nr:SDR family NAD(P)-dependent oxidoreductase [Phenylobacterium sp.]HXA38485.1 SDR family NAD(P)-dependent oxidoreductase [Phenylobacterium sp.]
MDAILQGQVAVITGASGGLGEHFAKVLAEQGAAVALAARRLEKVEAIAGELAGQGHRAMALRLDVADAASIAPAFDEIEAALGPISILINNAGVGGAGMALDMTVEHFDETFAVNVRGPYFAAQAAAKLMLASGVADRGEGRIVNIASVAAQTNLPGLSAYCASKASVVMMTRVMAREWARRGISVNALGPGYILTDINAEWFETEGGAAQLKRFPRRRLMQNSDLDAALLMLAGPAASAITGQLFIIDDGQTLPGGG